MESRFSAGQPDGLTAIRKKACFRKERKPIIVGLLRGLGTHDAELVALLGDQERIMSGARPDQSFDLSTLRVNQDNVIQYVLRIVLDFKQSVISRPERSNAVGAPESTGARMGALGITKPGYKRLLRIGACGECERDHRHSPISGRLPSSPSQRPKE